MEPLLLDIIDCLRQHGRISDHELAALINAANVRSAGSQRTFSKKRLLPYYFEVKRTDPQRWENWEVDEGLERALTAALRMKPRRTASGVATVTVITKPWPCAGDCSFCPSDLRMPKSYLHDEPACQRAERNFFDPYLQVSSRLRTLHEMGHPCDKVELIVLGGSWTDYPRSYRNWFVFEMLRALDEDALDEIAVRERREAYGYCGISWHDDELAEKTASEQALVDAGERSYADAWRMLYADDDAWGQAGEWQCAGEEDVAAGQLRNETAAHRCVGLVVETRPDAISCESLRELRQLGCTKVQIGVQSLDEGTLAACGRPVSRAQMERAFGLVRLFGFKIHAHFMANLPGADPERDKCDYREFMDAPEFRPDEVKLYPCALIEGTRLTAAYRRGEYRPYTHDELIDVLVADMACTPPWTRVSRMIRDFSSDDIVAGNKKPNLRQMVDVEIGRRGLAVDEMRTREVGTREFRVEELRLEEVFYQTSVSDEVFIQWVTSQGALAGFARLSLPTEAAFETYGDGLPTSPGEAMLRELHVYGTLAGLGDGQQGTAQHRGLGTQLVQRAEQIARERGYGALNVISAVGTRGYYRRLGFEDAGLYQRVTL